MKSILHPFHAEENFMTAALIVITTIIVAAIYPPAVG